MTCRDSDAANAVEPSQKNMPNRQVHMLRHHHLSEHSETIFAAHFFERRFEEFFRGSGSEVRLAPITTERDEVEISGLLVVDKALRHWREDTLRGQGFVVSHISKARCGAPG